MKLRAEIEKALNDQVNLELTSAYAYLAMAAYFESISYPGFSMWMRLQGNEELGHAQKIFQYIFDREGKLSLKAIPEPHLAFRSPLEVFEKSLGHEQKVSDAILKIYELADDLKDYPTQSFLKWFLDEQVEEEKTVSDFIGQLRAVGDSPSGILQLDREAARRSAK